MAHPYGTSAGIERIMRSSPPSTNGKVTFGSATSDDMSDADLASYIEDIDDWIDLKLRRWYKIELDMSDDETDPIIDISNYETAYRIWVDIQAGNRTDEDIPPTIQRWHLLAMELLDEIIAQAKDGEIMAGETKATKSDSQFVFARSSHVEDIYNEDITLTQLSWAWFNHDMIRKASEQVFNRVASDDTSDGFDVGSTVYTRDTDYEMDYPKGKIRRILSGSISDGDTVRVKIYSCIKDFPSEVSEMPFDEAGDYGDSERRIRDTYGRKGSY